MAHKAFSETEKEEFDGSESALTVDSVARKGLGRKPSQGLLSGWKGVVLGTGLGIAIALGGTRFLFRPTATPTVTQQSPQQPVMSVTVAPVQTNSVARTLNVTGTVAARDLIPVLPQTTGLQIKQILVEEGDVVKLGQVIAVLDNSVLQAQINEARADIESNQAVVGQRQAALAQARATLAEAQRNLQRYQELANAGAISRQELDTRATTAATAREAVRVAQANISSASADVRSSRASLAQLQTQLGQTLVRAPASGLIAEATAKVGDVANGTQRLFSIIENGALELQAQVPATQLPQVNINAPAVVTYDADPRVRLQGRVRDILPLVNPESRIATVRINLPPTSLLRSGMFARAAITTATMSGVTVPAKAVLPQPDGSAMVFVLSGADIVKAQTVQTGGVPNGGRVEITSGLKPGDSVVVAGAGYLKDGDRVRVVQQPNETS
ncbi:MAG: efflux RND transporter periplasmic adaptor subunit [Gloeocapsa sp. UFS-A4-WI-NPMV-4B04]|nr:efflux RND transporter periplasmic adaptor subunit [Gloeocapsa sp. UFS-A4-WI-NPMV-4B04]